VRTQLAPSGRFLALTAAFALAVSLVPAGAAQATPKDCGWSGNIKPLMEKADRQARTPRVAADVRSLFGPDARIRSTTRMEVDLRASSARKPNPTRAVTLTDNRVVYNLQVAFDGRETTTAVFVEFRGLCHRKTTVVDGAFEESIGANKPLKINANRALKLAQDYRKANSDAFPLDQPLHSMNLLQAATAPPDFGRLRWYVNYDTGRGLNILAVYMDGTVRPARGQS
jgi:hypothetical protein